MNEDFQLEREWVVGVDLARPGAEKTVLVTVPAAEVTKGRGVTRRPMVTYSVGSWDKHFSRSIYSGLATAGRVITDKEAAQVWRLFKRYRRQITHAEKERLLRVAEMRAAREGRKGVKV